LAQDFLALKAEVDHFGDDWVNVFKKLQVKHGDNRIENIRAQIKNAEAAQAVLKKKLVALGTAMGILSLTTTSAGVAGLFVPVALLGALVAAAASFGVGKLFARASDDNVRLSIELDQQRKELIAAQGTKDTVMKLQAALATSDGDFKMICETLGSLGTVWACIRTSLQSIQAKLENAEEEVMDRTFKLQVQSAASVYNVLAIALTAYQNTITSDKLPPKNVAVQKSSPTAFYISMAQSGPDQFESEWEWESEGKLELEDEWAEARMLKGRLVKRGAYSG